MFWRFGRTSSVSLLLEKPDVTLNEILDDSELLQELMSSNTTLVEYFREPEVLEKLVNFLVEDFDETKVEPEVTKPEMPREVELRENNESDSDDLNDVTMEHEQETPLEAYRRRAQMASEVLSADVWALTDRLMESVPLLDSLWGILDREDPVSVDASNYFTKVNEHLLDTKLESMIAYILKQENLVERFVRHVDRPQIMDFLLKTISSDKPDAPTGVIEVLLEQNLMPQLIEFLAPSVVSTVQSSVTDFLKAFITLSANSNTDSSTIGPNELTRQLVSEPMMRKLVSHMLCGGSGLANGVGLVIEIIRKNNSDYDYVPVVYVTIESHPPTPRDPIYLGALVNVFSEAIPQFTEMISRKEERVLETPFGSIEPLGFERFRICELVAELLHCSNMALLNDDKGESIVRERDEERVRLKSLDDVAQEVNNLRLNSPDANSTVEHAHEVEGEDQADHNLQEEDHQTDMDETILEVRNDSEEAIRANPVVGDRLKIALADNRVTVVILSMFFRFSWNNFLHNVVFDVVQQIFNGSMDVGYNRFLAIDLFGQGQITQSIIEGQRKCDDYEEQTGLRLGYMGHLTLIAEEVVKFTTLYQPLSVSSVIEESTSQDEWNKYVNETLVETREKYNAILGRSPDEEESVSEKAGDEEPKDQFSRYMSQQMRNDAPERFGSSDEDDDEEWSATEQKEGKRQMSYDFSPMGLLDDDDDYEDPNDDGQSYARDDHPLYSRGGLLNPVGPQKDEDYEEEFEKLEEPFVDPLSDSSEDEETAQGQDLGLRRSSSRGESWGGGYDESWQDDSWDSDEKKHLNMANYIQQTNDF